MSLLYTVFRAGYVGNQGWILARSCKPSCLARSCNLGSRTVTFSDRVRETVGGGIAPIFDLATTTEDVTDEESWSEIVNTKQEASQSTQDEREELVGATSDGDMVLHLENLK